MSNELQVVWCIKYALTTGIYELKGYIRPDGYFIEDSSPGIGHFLSKKDYCLTLEDAKIAAEELRKRKIKSLEKQMARVATQQIKIKGLITPWPTASDYFSATAMKEIEHIEIQQVDYKAACAALARRVSAAHAYEVSGKTFEPRAELEAAMQVIERVDTPIVFINPA